MKKIFKVKTKKSTKCGSFFIHNPIDLDFFKTQLNHEIIKYDEKLNKKQFNINRYEVMMRALDLAFEPLTNESSIEDLKLSLSFNFAPDFPPVVKFLKNLKTLPKSSLKSNPEIPKTLKCSTCKEAKWTCRDCGRKCCPEFCGNKTNFEKILTSEGWPTGKLKNQYLATCIGCKQKNGHKFFK